MEEMRVNISRLVIERDRLSAQRRTRAREREIKIVKDQLKEERRRQKGSLRTWRRQWWDSKITECEEANQNGDTGKMYRLQMYKCSVVPLRFNTVLYRDFPTVKVCNLWNSLPKAVVNAPSVDAFKGRLDKILPGLAFLETPKDY